MAFLSKGKSVTGIDLYPARIHHPRYTHTSKPFEQIGLECDILWSSHTLEHVNNPGAMLTKFRQWLRPGGWLCLVVPTNQQDRLHVGHLTLWTPAHLMYNLVVNGWDCREASWYTEYCSIAVLLQKAPDIDMGGRTAMPSEIDWLNQYMPRKVIHEGNAWWENRWPEPTEPRINVPPHVAMGFYKTDIDP